jgi:hypothetical protein
MGRIAARRIIAVVTDGMLGRYRAIRQNESIPMGSFLFSAFRKNAIVKATVKATPSLPFPATQVTPQAMRTSLHKQPKFLRSHQRHAASLKNQSLLSSHMNIIARVERVSYG